MKAMIFAAGLGTRLKPFTLQHPKALVPVGGVPMLQRVILKLKGAGITQMVVNVHHFADQIIDFLRENQNFGVDIAISDESGLLLDTGGGILAARPLLGEDEPFIVHNADILTDFDLQPMIHTHAATGADATLLVAERKTSRYLLLDEDLRMRGWTNVSTGEVKPACLDIAGLKQLAFGGVHILSPSVFPALEVYATELRTEGQGIPPFSIMPFYISQAAGLRDEANDGEIQAFGAERPVAGNPLRIQGYMPSMPYHWHDIGKPESLARAEAAILGIC